MEAPILLTGACGMLGSAIAVELARSSRQVLATDRREPDEQLLQDCPGIDWLVGDITDPDHLDRCFARLDDRPLVIHLAAHYDFEASWCAAYQTSNVDGLQLLVDRCAAQDCQRLYFASSLAVHEAASCGSRVDEGTAGNAQMPYGRSKVLGEAIIDAAPFPTAILRIGGVFTAWCELPPLYGLLDLWQACWPLNRSLLGRGMTGFPYLHRADLVTCVLAAVDRATELPRQVTLAACGQHSTDHNALFAAVHGEAWPLRLPPWLAGIGLRGRLLLGRCTGKRPIERPWMLRYVDKPIIVDTSRTCRLLDWRCRPELYIEQWLPRLIDRQLADQADWHHRNRERGSGRYIYAADIMPNADLEAVA